jgi:hypothetical protein
MYTTVNTALPRNLAGIPLYLRRARAMATTVWLRHSTMSFYCGLYGVEKYHWIPSLAQYETNSVDVNSSSLSMRITRSLRPLCS